MRFSIILKKIFAPDNLIINYHPENVFVLPSGCDDTVEEIWRDRERHARENNIRFYNGQLFNLQNIAINENAIEISIGACSYRDYVVTRTRRILDLDGSPVFANPLAICSAVITADSKILIGRRVGVDGSTGMFHVVGGFFERTKDHLNGSPSPFKAISREIFEETGVTIPCNDIVCLGIVYIETSPHPEMCFYAKTEMTFNAIAQLIPEDLEVSGWRYIDDTPDSLADYIVGKRDEIAPPGLADLILYGENSYGQGWLDSIQQLRKTGKVI